MKWEKATKSVWQGLPWPGHYENTEGYTNGLYFIYRSHIAWTIKYIRESGVLMGIGQGSPSGYETSDFFTLRDAKEAVSRLYEQDLHNIPDDPHSAFIEEFTRVLLGK